VGYVQYLHIYQNIVFITIYSYLASSLHTIESISVYHIWTGINWNKLCRRSLLRADPEAYPLTYPFTEEPLAESLIHALRFTWRLHYRPVYELTFALSRGNFSSKTPRGFISILLNVWIVRGVAPSKIAYKIYKNLGDFFEDFADLENFQDF